MVSAVPTPVKGDRSSTQGAPLRAWLQDITRASTSIFEGLAVTMSWMFRRPATIQYPDRIDKPVQEMLPDGYRGILEVDLLRCSGCMLCQRACPIDCLDIVVVKDPQTKGRFIERFDIDIGKCMYCGICSEACNFDALQHTTEFEGSATSLDDLLLHFATRPVPVSKHKAGQGPARRPQGSILREVIKPLYTRDKRTGVDHLAPAEAPPAPAKGDEE